MGKIKSAICITLFTLLIAALCFVCAVSFSYGTDGVHTFNSILRLTAKDADLGAKYGSDGYLGGGYTVVYYPEGVISAKEYEENSASYTDESELQKYKNRYVAYADGAIYLDKDEVCGGGNEPAESYLADFDATYELLFDRYANLKKDGVRLEKRDKLTVSVFLPKELMQNELYAFTVHSYTGAVTVRYGTSTDSSAAETVLPARADKTIGDYVKKFSSRTAADGTAYVVIDFTDLGREVIAAKTADATSGTLFFMAGENSLIPLSVSSQIDQESLYISGTYTKESAEICATALNTALKGDGQDYLSLTLGDSHRSEALYGANALYGLFIAFGVCFLAMMIFFFVRYGALGFAHLYTYLIMTFIMILCVWSIPFLYLSTETLLAYLIVSVVFSACNALVFERARKEFALGKTMTSSVKTAYRQNFWHIFDLHIILAALSFIVYGIALTNLSAFAFVLGLGTVFSGLCVLGLNRFMWAIMMAFTRNKGRFCNFKREVVDDD